MKIIIATPVDGADIATARVTVGYHNMVKRLVVTLGADQLPAEMLFGADVCRARNRAAALILQTYPSADYVLWLDEDTWLDDVGAVARMAATGEHLIYAPYTSKSTPQRWIHRLLDPCPVPEGDVQRVALVGFGCTMTSMTCLRRMYAACRKYTDYPSRNVVADMFGQMYGELVPSDRDADEKLSEDFSFCKRWNEIGGRTTAYLRAGVVWHAGTKAYSSGDLSRVGSS
jgi:hypothetical protein